MASSSRIQYHEPLPFQATNHRIHIHRNAHPQKGPRPTGACLASYSHIQYTTLLPFQTTVSPVHFSSSTTPGESPSLHTVLGGTLQVDRALSPEFTREPETSHRQSLGRCPSLSSPLYQLFQTDPTVSQKRENTDREDPREINSESKRARLSRFL
jgi:hypothetical protein